MLSLKYFFNNEEKTAQLIIMYDHQTTNIAHFEFKRVLQSLKI